MAACIHACILLYQYTETNFCVAIAIATFMMYTHICTQHCFYFHTYYLAALLYVAVCYSCVFLCNHVRS